MVTKELNKEEKQAKKLIEQWIEDIPAFCYDVLGIGRCSCGCKLDNQQILIMRDVVTLIGVKEKLAKNKNAWLSEREKEFRDKIGISIKSAKGVGKTAVLAIIEIWFLFCYREQVKSVVTAPRRDSLKDNLFPEISKWLSHSKKVNGENDILGQMIELDSLKMYLKMVYDANGKPNKNAIGLEGMLIGRTCSRNSDEATQKATMQGFHANYQILGADESFGVSNNVFEPLETTMTRPVNFMFLIGNPTKNSGYAYDTFNKNRKWWVNRTISAEESSLISPELIVRAREKYKDYPNMYRVNIQGEFPFDDEDSLIPFSKIMDAVELYKELDFNDKRYSGDGIVFGCDIGAGGDVSVVVKRQGIKVDILGKLQERDTLVTARWISQFIELNRPNKIGVDGIAWGKGTYDKLRELGYTNTIFVDARRRSSDNKRFKNLRAELYFKLAEAFINGQIAIPDDEELIKELSILKRVDNEDIIQIISKKQMKAEGIDSPNLADSLMMTYFFNDRIIREIKETESDRYSTNSRVRSYSWSAV